MPLLTRKKQFAAKVETTEGTAITLAGADVTMEVEELEARFTPEFAERHPLRTDLSPGAGVIGITQGEISGKTELKPGALVSTNPPMHNVLLACGLQQHLFRTGNTSAPTGTFVAGEYISGSITGTGFFIEMGAGNVMKFV